MSYHRLNKNKKALERMKTREIGIVEHKEQDQKILDVILSKLYNNTAKNTLHLEKEIYVPSRIKLNAEDAERIWEIMLSSGLITSVIGFGNSGRIELTRTGYQLMAQYGGYAQYLASLSQPSPPQTIILPIQVQEDPQPDTSPIICEDEKRPPVRKKRGKSGNRRK